MLKNYDVSLLGNQQEMGYKAEISTLYHKGIKWFKFDASANGIAMWLGNKEKSNGKFNCITLDQKRMKQDLKRTVKF